MARTLTDAEREAFLAEPRPGILSVAQGDGRPPHATPVWFAFEPGGNLSFFTGTQGRRSAKARLVEASGGVSLSVQREQLPYAYVTVEGTVVGIERPPTAEAALAIARRYLPEAMAQGFVAAELSRPSSEFVLFTVRPDRWLAFDFSDDAG